MSETQGSSMEPPNEYDTFFRDFETPLMQEIRRQLYGEDNGLHSWGTMEELQDDLHRLNISSSSRIADLGCGACGALAAILAAVGCTGTGIDRSASALVAGQSRAVAMGVDDLMDVQLADLDEPLPFDDKSFNAILAIDMVPHLRDRHSFFQEVARLLVPGGRFLCIDPCVLTGSASNHDLHERLTWGYTQVAALGWNERLLEESGLRLMESQNRTTQALHAAELEKKVYEAHRAELERQFEWFEAERHQAYLEAATRLSREQRMARIMYLAVREQDD